MAPKLTDKERLIVTAVEQSADASVEGIARELGLRAHAVRYVIEDLTHRGLISRTVFLNVYPLGFVEYCIFCSLGASSKGGISKLVQFLQTHEKVSYVAELGGDYQLCFTLTVRNGVEAHAELTKITAKYEPLVVRRSISLTMSLDEYGARLSRPAQRPSLRFGTTATRTTYDQTDHEILRTIAAHPELNVPELSRAVGSPPSTVHYRLRRLKEAGVLVAYRYLIERNDDLLYTHRFLVFTRGLSPRARDHFLAVCARTSGITFVIQALGEWEFEIGVRTASPGEAMTIQREIVEALGQNADQVKLVTTFKLWKLCKYPFRQFPPSTLSEY